MKKGFTLIELLAVIVILAIIALIATPIILGIINDAKEDSNKRSVENYAHAVELAVARAATKQGGVIEEGTYSISNDGKIVTSPTGKEITIDYKGEKITGTVEVDSKGKIKLLGVSLNDSDVLYDYSEENGVEEVNNTVFEGKITFTFDEDEWAYFSNVCLEPGKFKDKSTYKVTVTDSNGNDKIYEAISLFGGSYAGDGFTLAQNYDFWYTYYTDSKTCLWGALNEELKLAGEQNIKIEYLNSSEIDHHYLILRSAYLDIFSTELVEGEVTVEIKDNHGKITTRNGEVEMIDGQAHFYNVGDFKYYVGLLDQGETITITVTQNGKSYTLDGSEFKYSSGDDFCFGENYYWGNINLGYYSGC